MQFKGSILKQESCVDDISSLAVLAVSCQAIEWKVDQLKKTYHAISWNRPKMLNGKNVPNSPFLFQMLLMCCWHQPGGKKNAYNQHLKYPPAHLQKQVLDNSSFTQLTFKSEGFKRNSLTLPRGWDQLDLQLGPWSLFSWLLILTHEGAVGGARFLALSPAQLSLLTFHNFPCTFRD